MADVPYLRLVAKWMQGTSEEQTRLISITRMIRLSAAADDVISNKTIYINSGHYISHVAALDKADDNFLPLMPDAPRYFPQLSFLHYTLTNLRSIVYLSVFTCWYCVTILMEDYFLAILTYFFGPVAVANHNAFSC